MKERELNTGQIKVLELLYKYRFGSVKLLKESMGLKDNSGLYQKLEALVNREYIGKRYDRNFRLDGKPAAYYLLPKGLKKLQALNKDKEMTNFILIDYRKIKASYKDRIASTSFIDNQLKVYSACLDLQRLYPGLSVFTKRELDGFIDHLPSPLPDAFISLKVKEQKKPYRYLLDVIPENLPRFVIDKKIETYCEFFEAGSWDLTNSPAPAIILLAESGSFERKLQRLVSRKLYSLDSDEDLRYYTSTISALRNANKNNKNIWSNVEDPEEVLELSSLAPYSGLLF